MSCDVCLYPQPTHTLRAVFKYGNSRTASRVRSSLLFRFPLAPKQQRIRCFISLNDPRKPKKQLSINGSRAQRLNNRFVEPHPNDTALIICLFGDSRQPTASRAGSTPEDQRNLALQALRTNDRWLLRPDDRRSDDRRLLELGHLDGGSTNQSSV